VCKFSSRWDFFLLATQRYLCLLLPQSLPKTPWSIEGIDSTIAVLGGFTFSAYILVVTVVVVSKSNVGWRAGKNLIWNWIYYTFIDFYLAIEETTFSVHFILGWKKKQITVTISGIISPKIGLQVKLCRVKKVSSEHLLLLSFHPHAVPSTHANFIHCYNGMWSAHVKGGHRFPFLPALAPFAAYNRMRTLLLSN